MTLVEASLNKIVRDIINNIVEISDFAIAAKQNAPRPATSYASVDVITINKVGWEEQELTDRVVDADVDSKREGYREVMYSLNFYRTGAYDNALKVQIGLVRQAIYEALWIAEMGLGSRSEVRDISEPLEKGWEERAQFDLVLSVIGTDEEIIRSIEQVTIQGDFETRGTSFPVTVEVIL